jgi:uncharacterized protein YcfJ
MLSMVRRQAVIALALMAFLVCGAVAAEARDTNGSDRLVKGAAIGAAVGAVTQAVRGRTGGRELLKGAAVGGAVGAAVGAYSDYQQEKSAREHEERRADYYEARAYDRGRYRTGRAFRAQRFSGPLFYNDAAPVHQVRNGRAVHRHNRRCRH